MKSNVVTRIAPSPTGEMHIGTVRTALFNYIFAKQNGGTYFVRIEDTDRERNKPEWVEAIWRDFTWCGLEPDAKYVQSANLERHKELLKKLVAEGKAYVSREPKKDDPSQEVEVVRLKNPGTTITFVDLIRGEVTFDTTEHGDFVIARSLEDPLYHFAVVADDGDAKVTHVLRSEEHISNTPRQILILEALGFKRPVYAHFPLILAPDRAKLSKRKHGASVGNYQKQGFVPEAILNYVALLGWNPGGEQEVFTLSELTKLFSMERVHKGGAIFDIQKFTWFNFEHLKRLSDAEYEKRLREFSQQDFDARLVPLIKERAQTLVEAAELLKEYDFMTSVSYDPGLLLNKGKTGKDDASKHLQAVQGLIEGVADEDFTAVRIKDTVMPYAEQEGRGAVLWPLRVALSGKEKSPDPFTIAALVGKAQALVRIAQALKSF
ncbi:MAG TPA: glutamate--tRNA ligase family protein [Candidatus Paceibacterota bacterium]|nr:glutamate--tRNA ligase family protein [Candidatus Paceibacterota bacterium]